MVDKKYPHMTGHNKMALALYVVVKAMVRKWELQQIRQEPYKTCRNRIKFTLNERYDIESATYTILLYPWVKKCWIITLFLSSDSYKLFVSDRIPITCRLVFALPILQCNVHILPEWRLSLKTPVCKGFTAKLSLYLCIVC